MIVEEETKDHAGPDEVFDFESVNGRVMSWSEPDLHEVEDVAGATNEEQLHDEVVEGNPTPQQIHVASDEYHNIQSLRFERDAST